MTCPTTLTTATSKRNKRNSVLSTISEESMKHSSSSTSNKTTTKPYDIETDSNCSETTTASSKSNTDTNNNSKAKLLDVNSQVEIDLTSCQPQAPPNSPAVDPNADSGEMAANIPSPRSSTRSSTQIAASMTNYKRYGFQNGNAGSTLFSSKMSSDNLKGGPLVQQAAGKDTDADEATSDKEDDNVNDISCEEGEKCPLLEQNSADFSVQEKEYHQNQQHQDKLQIEQAAEQLKKLDGVGQNKNQEKSTVTVQAGYQSMNDAIETQTSAVSNSSHQCREEQQRLNQAAFMRQATEETGANDHANKYEEDFDHQNTNDDRDLEAALPNKPNRSPNQQNRTIANGQNAQNKLANQKEEPKKKNNLTCLLIILAVVVVVIVGGILFFFLVLRKDSEEVKKDTLEKQKKLQQQQLDGSIKDQQNNKAGSKSNQKGKGKSTGGKSNNNTKQQQQLQKSGNLSSDDKDQSVDFAQHDQDQKNNKPKNLLEMNPQTQYKEIVAYYTKNNKQQYSWPLTPYYLDDKPFQLKSGPYDIPLQDYEEKTKVVSAQKETDDYDYRIMRNAAEGNFPSFWVLKMNMEEYGGEVLLNQGPPNMSQTDFNKKALKPDYCEYHKFIGIFKPQISEPQKLHPKMGMDQIYGGQYLREVAVARMFPLHVPRTDMFYMSEKMLLGRVGQSNKKLLDEVKDNAKAVMSYQYSEQQQQSDDGRKTTASASSLPGKFTLAEQYKEKVPAEFASFNQLQNKAYVEDKENERLRDEEKLYVGSLQKFVKADKGEMNFEDNPKGNIKQEIETLSLKDVQISFLIHMLSLNADAHDGNVLLRSQAQADMLAAASATNTGKQSESFVAGQQTQSQSIGQQKNLSSSSGASQQKSPSNSNQLRSRSRSKTPVKKSQTSKSRSPSNKSQKSSRSNSPTKKPVSPSKSKSKSPSKRRSRVKSDVGFLAYGSQLWNKNQKHKQQLQQQLGSDGLVIIDTDNETSVKVLEGEIERLKNLETKPFGWQNKVKRIEKRIELLKNQQQAETITTKTAPKPIQGLSGGDPDYNSMTVVELEAELEKLGKKFMATMKKNELKLKIQKVIDMKKLQAEIEQMKEKQKNAKVGALKNLFQQTIDDLEQQLRQACQDQPQDLQSKSSSSSKFQPSQSSSFKKPMMSNPVSKLPKLDPIVTELPQAITGLDRLVLIDNGLSLPDQEVFAPSWAESNWLMRIQNQRGQGQFFQILQPNDPQTVEFIKSLDPCYFVQVLDMLGLQESIPGVLGSYFVAKWAIVEEQMCTYDLAKFYYIGEPGYANIENYNEQQCGGQARANNNMKKLFSNKTFAPVLFNDVDKSKSKSISQEATILQKVLHQLYQCHRLGGSKSGVKGCEGMNAGQMFSKSLPQMCAAGAGKANELLKKVDLMVREPLGKALSEKLGEKFSFLPSTAA